MSLRFGLAGADFLPMKEGRMYGDEKQMYHGRLAPMDMRMDNQGAMNAAAMGAEKREPVSHEIMQLVVTLAERSEVLAVKVQGKLEPVMTPPGPRPDGQCPKETREWPPLFAEIRKHLVQVLTAMGNIDDALNRTEL
jgi:hypothetical protein